MKKIVIIASVFLVSIHVSNSAAQELEARSVDNLPVGINLLTIGYGYSTGNILLDPALPVENLNAQLHLLIASYARTLDFWGKPARFDAILPFTAGDWEYTFAGAPDSRTIDGLGDLRLRLTMLFSGARAMGVKDFTNPGDNTIFAASLQVILPTGQYDPTELINLGSNRWTFRLQAGMKHGMGKWALEAIAGVWLFTDNTKFLEDNKLGQRPLLVAKLHLVRNFSKGIWAALDVGYGYGGRTLINGTERNIRISAFRFGLTGGIPLSPKHILRISAVSGVRLERGPDFDALVLAYSYVW